MNVSPWIVSILRRDRPNVCDSEGGFFCQLMVDARYIDLKSTVRERIPRTILCLAIAAQFFVCIDPFVGAGFGIALGSGDQGQFSGNHNRRGNF